MPLVNHLDDLLIDTLQNVRLKPGLCLDERVEKIGAMLELAENRSGRFEQMQLRRQPEHPPAPDFFFRNLSSTFSVEVVKCPKFLDFLFARGVCFGQRKA